MSELEKNPPGGVEVDRFIDFVNNEILLNDTEVDYELLDSDDDRLQIDEGWLRSQYR